MKLKKKNSKPTVLDFSWQELIKGIPDIIIVHDKAGKILFINRTISGISIDEPIGKSVFHYVPKSHHKTMRDSLRTVFKHKRETTFEIKGQGPDNTVSWYATNIGPIKIGNKVLAAVQTARDITELKRMENEIINISDDVQRRIGQDLHDSLSQQLTGIAFLAKSLENKLTALKTPETQHAKKLVELVNKSISHTHHLARHLHPIELTDRGLVNVLQNLAKTTENIFKVKCTFVKSIDKKSQIDISVATHLYRIAQEAIVNAVKHAKPGRIMIYFKHSGQKLILKITDDGTGMPKRKINHGMGLRLMKYRTGLIDASFEITPAKPRGTSIVVAMRSRSKILAK